MVLFGLDISHHQGDRPQLWFHQARAAGIEFCIMKATEGNGFVDRRFSANVEKARNAGMLIAAYHYQRSNVSAASQVNFIRSVVPRDCAVIPDVEANSGGADLTWEIVRLLLDNNYKVPFTYFPRWYWQNIGRPSLAGLPPLWASRYPDNVHGSIQDEWDDVRPHFWEGYGGLPVELLQFTSSGRVAGYAPLDINAFRGTRADLARRFTGTTGGGGTPPSAPTLTEDDQMELRPGIQNSRTLVVPKGAAELVYGIGYDVFTVHATKFFGPTPEQGLNTLAEYGEQVVDGGRSYALDVPDGAVTAEVLYSHDSANGQHSAVVGFR